jgi:DNA-binding XRE family transcriptional regulator
MFAAVNISTAHTADGSICWPQSTFIVDPLDIIYMFIPINIGIDMRPDLILSPADLAAVLKRRRKELRVRQEELAGLYDMSRYTVIAAESGEGDPKLSTVLKLVEALGLRLVAIPGEVMERVVIPAAPPPPPDLVDVDDADWEIGEDAP